VALIIRLRHYWTSHGAGEGRLIAKADKQENRTAETEAKNCKQRPRRGGPVIFASTLAAQNGEI